MRVTIDPAFDIDLPERWTASPDEDGGISVAGPEAIGLLHLISFEQPLEQDLDPAEELYTFLEEQGIELEEDEVEDFQLEGGAELSLCEYAAEEDEDDPEAGESTYWIVAVATARGKLVFSSYSCPVEAMDTEREVIRGILTTLRLTPRAASTG